jgi:hypothetical protein
MNAEVSKNFVFHKFWNLKPKYCSALKFLNVVYFLNI